MPSKLELLRSNWWRTSKLVSATMCSGVFKNKSSEREITPSVEFSTGTTPNWALPATVERNTSSILAQGTCSMLAPKHSTAACSL